MQQKRLILALVLSSAILFAWSYFYPVKPPQNNQSAAATSSPSPTVNPATGQASTSGTTQPGPPAPGAAAGPINAAPQRTITIRTPLYVVKFDSQGGEPVSWVLIKNRNTNKL